MLCRLEPGPPTCNGTADLANWPRPRKLARQPGYALQRSELTSLKWKQDDAIFAVDRVLDQMRIEGCCQCLTCGKAAP